MLKDEGCWYVSVLSDRLVNTCPQEEKLRAELMARASKRSEHQLQWDEEFEEGNIVCYVITVVSVTDNSIHCTR